MRSQDNTLGKRAISALLAAQAQFCLGQTGQTIEQIGPLIHLHTDPPLFWEIDTFYVEDITPATAVGAVRACKPNPRHILATFTHEPDILAAAYADFGYRNGNTMPLMGKVLAGSEYSPLTFSVQRVTDQAAMNRLNAGERQRMPFDHLHVPQLRYYFVEEKGHPICWGRAFYAPDNVIYVSAIETQAEYRRRGLATALMETIHADAAAMGQTASCLCASELAYELYTKLGYQTITTLLELVPKEVAREND